MKETMRCCRAISGAALALVLMGSVAHADTVAVEDAQDTGDVMDVASARHGHSEALPDVLVHSLSTFEEWTNEEFIGAQVRIWLPDRDKSYDRILVIARDDAQQTLRGFVYGNPSGRLRSFAEVSRPDGRTLAAELPTSALAGDLDSYRWKAFLSYPCDAPPGAECMLPPPDTHEGRMLHAIGGQ